MQRSRVRLLLILLLVGAAGGLSIVDHAPGAPRMWAVEPQEAKPGDAVVVFGDHLNGSRIQELYLTNVRAELSVETLEQSLDAIRFKVPGGTLRGRYWLAYPAPGVELILLVQPVSLAVR